MAKATIGEELRRERIRQSLTLEQIAQRTKIPVRSLEAIEADGFDRLPGLVFTRNFVRLFALDLKLDPETLLARLPRVDIEAAPMPDPPARPGRGKWDPRLTAAVAVTLWVITATAAGTGAWYYFNRYAKHSVAVAAAPAPKSTPSAKSDRPTNASTATQSAPTGVPDQAENQAGNEAYDNTRPVQVILTAHDVVWVQVSADGRTAFVGTLHPNDKRVVAADAQVSIKTGNAGGLDISLNGRPLDPIGPTGQTRTVRLTAEGPQFGPQNRPASSPL